MEVKYGNPYVPKVARIEGVRQETSDIKTFQLVFLERVLQERFSFQPGQFVSLTVFGIGEIPLCLSSPPRQKDSFEVTVRAIGSVTRALHRLRQGDFVGVRGPFGSTFDLLALKGKNTFLIAGGTGIVPMHSLLLELAGERDAYSAIELFYGARTPADLVFKRDLAEILPSSRITVRLTVDVASEFWKGAVGLVTKLIQEAQPSPENAVVLACGPPRMLCACAEVLKAFGFVDRQIFLSMERNMKCGIGKCGHCAVGSKYVCVDGPVFRMDEANKLRD